MHVEVTTVGCGSFMVPVGHITIHCMGEKTRVLFEGDPEWREVSAEERIHILSCIAEHNKRLSQPQVTVSSSWNDFPE